MNKSENKAPSSVKHQLPTVLKSQLNSSCFLRVTISITVLSLFGQ